MFFGAFFFFLFHFPRFFEMNPKRAQNVRVVNGHPNPFAPLLPPALFSRAYCNGNDVAFYASETRTPTPSYTFSEAVPLINLVPSTPPLIIREDLYEIMEITQEEFLQSINGWNPVSLQTRSSSYS